MIAEKSALLTYNYCSSLHITRICPRKMINVFYAYHFQVNKELKKHPWVNAGYALHSFTHAVFFPNVKTLQAIGFYSNSISTAGMVSLCIGMSKRSKLWPNQLKIAPLPEHHDAISGQMSEYSSTDSWLTFLFFFRSVCSIPHISIMKIIELHINVAQRVSKSWYVSSLVPILPSWNIPSKQHRLLSE